MPLTPTFNLTAANVPALPATPALRDPDANGPTTFWPFATADDPDDALAHINSDMMRGDLLGRFGGGMDAILFGLGLSATGTAGDLALTIAAGQARLDGVVTYASETDGLASGHTYSVWAMQDKTILKVPDSLALPGARGVYRGQAVTAGGTITGLDYSGVPLAMRGGVLIVVADAGVPGPIGGTSNPADQSFWVRSAGGLYLWDGASYRALAPPWLVAGVAALTDAATIAVDASRGSVFAVTLAGNRTLGAPTNPTDGQTITVYVTQDGTGSRTLAYDAIYQFSTTIPSPTLSTAAGATDELRFQYLAGPNKWRVQLVNKGF